MTRFTRRVRAGTAFAGGGLALVLAAGLLAAPAGASTATGRTTVQAGATTLTGPYCGITWGSLPKSAGRLSSAPLVNVRAGQHDCYDRIVMDIRGKSVGYKVSYVSTVYDQAGRPMKLRGGAFLQIDLLNPAYDGSGHSTYNPKNRSEIVNLTGYRTFRQAAFGGSYEGYTTIGLGVRARLPFRVFTLDGPGDLTRIVIDVAHKW
jgi:hypothetical protein